MRLRVARVQGSASWFCSLPLSGSSDCLASHAQIFEIVQDRPAHWPCLECEQHARHGGVQPIGLGEPAVAFAKRRA